MGKKNLDKEIYSSCYQQPTATTIADCAGCGLPPAPVPPCPPCFAPDGAVPTDHLYDQLRAYLDAFCLNPVFVQYGFDFLKNPRLLRVIFIEAFRSIIQTFSCQGYHVIADVFDQTRLLVLSYDVSNNHLILPPDAHYGVSTSAPEVIEALANIGRCGDCWDGLAIRAEHHNILDCYVPYCQEGAIYRARAFGDYKCNPYTYIIRFSINGTLNQFNMLIPALTVINTDCCDDIPHEDPWCTGASFTDCDC